MKLTKEECLEALNRIAFNYGIDTLDGKTNEIMDEKFNHDIGAMQQLIQEHFELVENHEILKQGYRLLEEKTKLVKEIEKNNLVSSLTSEVDKLNKALDKACEELERVDKDYTYELNRELFKHREFNQISFGYQTKEEWKEYLLNEN